jgi:hypothetical protein
MALQHGLTVESTAWTLPAVIMPHTHRHLKVRAERPRTYNKQDLRASDTWFVVSSLDSDTITSTKHPLGLR